MLNGVPYLRIREDDQKRLRKEFNDEKIHYGFNVQSKELQAWYKPNSGRPYKVCAATSVCHAIYQMREQLKYEKMRATDLLKEIDEYNEKVIKDKETDAMTEVRLDLQRIASGKQYFTMANPQARRFRATGS